MGVSKNRENHQNGWVIMVPNPMNKWMIWGVFPYFWFNTHMKILYTCFIPRHVGFFFLSTTQRSVTNHLHVFSKKHFKKYDEIFVSSGYMGVSKNSGIFPQIMMFFGFFHYFHHPFWGGFPPIFGNTSQDPTHLKGQGSRDIAVGFTVAGAGNFWGTPNHMFRT